MRRFILEGKETDSRQKILDLFYVPFIVKAVVIFNEINSWNERLRQSR